MTRSLFVALTALTAIAAVPPVATAQTYPNKPVRIIVPFSPATAADIVTRQLGVKLAEAYPTRVPLKGKAPAAFIYTGVPRLFAAAGFEVEQARERGKQRMRKHLQEKRR